MGSSDITINSKNLNCGWLLSEIEKLFLLEQTNKMGNKIVTAVKTKDNNTTLDFYLTQVDRYH